MARKQNRQPADERLLDTAVDRFGREGLKGASTRAIASAAGTMMSSITYHFGGKEGLYLAAAQHIADQIMERMSPVLAESDGASSREDAAAAILAILDRFTEVMTHPESEPWARFIVREQMEPTEAFDALFETVGQVAGRVACLLGLVSEGRLTPFDARLRVLAIVGQVLAYRTAHAALLRLTGWSEVDPEGVAAIRRIVHEHTRAILSSDLGASSDE